MRVAALLSQARITPAMLKTVRLQQGFAINEMGLNDHFAWQQA
jgi:hypothetical protein